MKTMKKQLLFLLLFLIPSLMMAQSDIPEEYVGREVSIARGVMNGNLIESNFRNHGEFSRYLDNPYGVWPRGTGNFHIGGIGLYIGGRVTGERVKWPEFFPNATTDTLLSPVAHNYRGDAGGVRAPTGSIWGWLPKNGFHNDRRIDPFTGQRQPSPAMSNDPTTWPEFWPDKLGEEDAGWRGQWNGFFGKGIRNADLESYFVMDDYGDKEYTIDASTGQPNSPLGVFYPDANDSTKGGLGLEVKTRIMQWANVLSEDVAFILYEITNTGTYNHGATREEGLYFVDVADYNLGDEEVDGVGEFDPQFDIAFGWDESGDGLDGGRTYPIGYVGFAFLESPSDAFDGLDNDEDGITDERRDSGPGTLIEGQQAIMAYVEANYNLEYFENTSVFNGFGPVEEQPAYQAGRWWTGDENMNWVGYSDVNENGVWDEGEPVNNDVGADGLGPLDFGYTGPDEGEADGIPTDGEPNFDRLDIPESDQIGLTGYEVTDRRNYQPDVNPTFLKTDDWLMDRFISIQFPLGTKPQAEEVPDIEPFIAFVSGPVELPAQRTDYFSLAWLFGENREDFYKNRRTVQNIYNANYNFAQPPIMPTLTAVPGDGQVILAWDSLSVASFDRFSQEQDFEGYRVYKGTDPLMSDARVVTDVTGAPTFYKPIAQFDLDNEYEGPVPVLENSAAYDLGSNTGLQFYYVDNDVNNGVRYYYAVVAYDRGVYTENGDTEIDPQENIFNFTVDAFSNIQGTSRNAAAVVPRAPAAGYVQGGANEDLSKVAEGDGTGSIEVSVVNETSANFDAIYKFSFISESVNAATYQTTHYVLENVATGDTIVVNSMAESTPYLEGFYINIFNDETIEYDLANTGWVDNVNTDNEVVDLDPGDLEGYQTNWSASIIEPSGSLAEYVPDNFELRFTDTASYRTPVRFQGNIYLTGKDLNFFAVNTTTGNEVDILAIDENDNDEADVEDTYFISEVVPGSGRKIRHEISFVVPEGEESVSPGDGAVLRIANKKPFKTGDFFQFTLSESGFDAELAKSELDDIIVVPNPYIATNNFELNNTTQSSAERRIAFMNLPPQCTISIYNVRGELIREFEHNSTNTDGQAYWDLRTKDKQDVAYGVYIYHIDAKGVGQKRGKFALIK